MNPFAAKLTEYINADGRTVARICRESGGKVRTVTLHAYKDGRRLPQNMDRVTDITAALGLNKAHTEMMRRMYRHALDLQNEKRLETGVQS